VLSKALALGLPSVLVINKVDRQDARAKEVLDLVYSLYIDLGANEHQIDFPVIYAVAREGRAAHTVAGAFESDSLKPLFDAILTHIPPPPEEEHPTLQMLVDNLDYDDYVGRLAIGRVASGVAREGAPISVIREEGKIVSAKIVRLYVYDGLKRVEVKDAGPGEIVCIAGADEIGIGDTLCDPSAPVALPRISVEEPTMSMVFRVNEGPFAGREGKYVTSRNIRERLHREAYKNVSIRVEDTETPDAFKVVGRGELQLAVIVENMRREGFELTVSNPEPILKTIAGEVHEPMELLVCDLPADGVGAVTGALGPRKGRMVDMQPLGSGRTRLQFRVPARGLIGFRSDFLTLTRGEGILSSQFDGYEPWQGRIDKRQAGAIVSDGRLRLLLRPGARQALREAGRQGLQRHDRGRALPRQRHRVQHLPREEAHQHPRGGPGREHHPHAAAGHEPREVARVDRRGRAGRGDPALHPAAQEGPRSERPLPPGARPQARRLRWAAGSPGVAASLRGAHPVSIAKKGWRSLASPCSFRGSVPRNRSVSGSCGA
jgi:GTP-binding protein TypA/BipA